MLWEVFGSTRLGFPLKEGVRGPRRALRSTLLSCSLAVVGSWGCTDPEIQVTSRLRFAVVVGDEPFACGQRYAAVGADGSSFEAHDARFFVHDVQLLSGDRAQPFQLDADGLWQRDGFALLDFENAGGGCRFGTRELHTTLSGTAPAEGYDGIRFSLGVPLAFNHGDQASAAAPLNTSSLFWSWNAGYKFVRVDGALGDQAVAMHLGSTGCEGGGPAGEAITCRFPNRFQVELRDFDPQRHAVALDLRRLFADIRSGDGFCISPPDGTGCQDLLSHLGGLPGLPADAFRLIPQADLPAPVDAGVPEAQPSPPSNLPSFEQEDCQDEPPSEPFVWSFLPVGFPTPAVPDDNPMSEDKVELGRRLFYDKQLSFNGSMSCASCHDQALSFTDGLAGSVGSTGEVHRRSSMSLANVAYYARFTWANSLLNSLEEQVLGPLFGDNPVELGWAGHDQVLLQRLREDPQYPELFETAFGGDCEPVSLRHLAMAIAAFERTLISGNSPYDRYWFQGDLEAMSRDALAGQSLFNSERLECFHCHGGTMFTGNSAIRFDEALFANNGLYDVDGKGAYPAVDQGLVEVTKNPEDMGHFKPPSLRNVTLTAPYMHDGSVATLDAVLDHYAAPRQGGGFLLGFQMNDEERRQVLAFLQALTDVSFLSDPRISSPFE